MPAFTQLCAKVNISLFDDTITIYPKLTGKKKLRPLRNHPVFGPLNAELDCVVKEAKKVVKGARWGELNEAIHFVHRDDARHDEYHQDKFSMDSTHYHMQFSKAIDENKLKEILAVFVKYQLISPTESQYFLSAYKVVQGNLTLPSANFLGTVLFGLQQNIGNLQTEDKNKKAFIVELKIMTEKAIELENKAILNAGYLEAACQARLLCSSLYEAYVKFDSETSQTCVEFQNSCNLAIDLARVELQQQRQWKGEFAEVCANIGLAIAMLVVGYIAYGLYNQCYNNDRFMFFRLNTDSVEKLDNVQLAVEQGSKFSE